MKFVDRSCCLQLFNQLFIVRIFNHACKYWDMENFQTENHFLCISKFFRMKQLLSVDETRKKEGRKNRGNTPNWPRNVFISVKLRNILNRANYLLPSLTSFFLPPFNFSSAICFWLTVQLKLEQDWIYLIQ